MPVIPTSAAAVNASRPAATERGKRINVNESAAGFNAGAASINASEASKRRVRPYIPSNTGAAQQEHSIKGTPVAAPENVDRSPEPVNASRRRRADCAFPKISSLRHACKITCLPLLLHVAVACQG